VFITAKEIIKKYLYFRHLVPNINNWNEEKLKNNSFYYKLFLQLRAIFCAFNLGLLRDFEKGSFVRNFPIESFEKLIEFAQQNNCLDNCECVISNQLNYKCLELLFIDLWDWRSKIDEILHLNCDFENIGGINLYAYQQISKVNYLISQNLGIVDELLGYLITPVIQKISIDELVEKYDYPIIDTQVEIQ